MLRVDDLRVAYGAVVAVRSATFALDEGDVVALTGPNGAGKTSALSAIAGVIEYTGSVVLGERDLRGLSAERRATQGLAFVPDGRRLFGKLSVEQNLLVGAVRLTRPGARAALEAAYAQFPLLSERRAQRADTLSGGEGQLLTIARALVASPSVLLVDEPFQGLSAEATSLVSGALRAAAEAGATVAIASPEPVEGVRSIPMHAGTIEAVPA